MLLGKRCALNRAAVNNRGPKFQNLVAVNMPGQHSDQISGNVVTGYDILAATKSESLNPRTLH